MNRLRPLLLPALGLAALLLLSSVGARWMDAREAPGPAAADAVAIGWEDLVPAGFVQPPDPFITMPKDVLAKLMDGSEESDRELERIEASMRHAPVEESLDGRHVTLPGYVVPLDFDGQTRLTEFLLVPYYGACIHTPPPPANQIVLAELDEPVVVADTYEPVELRGILRTESADTDVADAGYRMEVLSVGAVER